MKAMAIRHGIWWQRCIRPIGEHLAYIRNMLGELRRVAAVREGCDMLCYLIEMAYVEAGDVDRSAISVRSGSAAMRASETRPPE